jgi:hypothetical protein
LTNTKKASKKDLAIKNIGYRGASKGRCGVPRRVKVLTTFGEKKMHSAKVR